MSPQAIALFIGDSYTHGVGATTEENRWSALVAKEFGWVEVNQAYPGAGYTKRPRKCEVDVCPYYGATIEAVADTIAPDFVVIAGGQNDFKNFEADESYVADSVRRTFALAAEKFPSSQLISVGPSSPARITRGNLRFEDYVRISSQDFGAVHVDLMTPNVVDPSFLDADRVHVNVRGHAAIANRIITTLRNAGHL